jgi:hypothetical protein
MKFLDVPQSGSYASATHSRNQFGQYVRVRATPVNPRSPAQVNQRTRQSVNAAAWRALTATQRAGWGSLGAQMSRTDALGQSYTLTGFQAYCSVNNNLAFTGLAAVSSAPLLAIPTGLASATVTLTSASFSIAYTATPLPAATYLIVRCSKQRSAGRSYEADYRAVFTSAAAAASPANVLSAYQAKFGNPVTGNKIFISLTVSSGGFESASLLVAQVVA